MIPREEFITNDKTNIFIKRVEREGEVKRHCQNTTLKKDILR